MSRPRRARRFAVERKTYRRERGDALGGAYVVEVDRDTEWWLLCELCACHERFFDLDMAIDGCERHAVAHVASGRE